MRLQKQEPYQFKNLTYNELEALRLKEKNVSPPVLEFHAPRVGTVDTDACYYKSDCLLLQSQREGPTKPVGCWLLALIPAERAYDTTQPDDLPGVWAVLPLHL